MNAIFIRSRHIAALTAGAVLVLCGARLVAADASSSTASSKAASSATADPIPTFSSYIKISGWAPSISGNKTAYQSEMRQYENGSGGIEDMHLTRDLSKDLSLVVDGHALFGAEDYLVELRLTKSELGTTRFGFKRFRTFYDGVGGFFPLNNRWMAPLDQELHVDRTKFWLEQTFELADLPLITIRYTNELRNGKKDSTIWGDSDFTGLPNNTPPISQVRKFAPSYIKLGERHEELEISARKTVANTTILLTAVDERVNNLDTRYVTRFPGEVRLFPAPAATVLLPAANMNNQAVQIQSDGMRSNMVAFTAKADTVFTEKLSMHVAASTRLLHADFSGDRTILTSTPTATGVFGILTAPNLGLVGGSRVQTTTGSFTFDWKPTKDLFVKTGLRAEYEKISGQSTYRVVAASGTPAVNLATTSRVAWATIAQDSTTPVLDLRYTGIRDLSLYFNGSLRNLGGREKNTSAYNPITALNGTLANNNVSEDHGDYAFGANWRQSGALSLRGEIYRKLHKNGSVGYGINLGDNYFYDSDFTGAKLSAIAKPTPTLSFTTRYVYQKGKGHVTGYLPTFPAYNSYNSKNHTIAQSIDWAPSNQAYVQLNLNQVFNVISTAFPRAGYTLPSGTSLGFDSNSVLQNSNNNYFSGSAVTGFAADKKTDVQIQFTYYRANNLDAQLARLTMPYGVAVREYTITVGAKRALNEKLILCGKVGYMEGINDTTGGNTNFRGPLAYVSLDFAL